MDIAKHELLNEGQVTDILRTLITIFSLGYWGFIIYYAWYQTIPRPKYGVLFAGLGMIGYILIEAENTVGDRRLSKFILSIPVTIIVLTTSAHVYLNFETLIFQRTGYILYYEYIIGILFVISVIYLTYDAFDTSFVVVLLASLFYGYFGPAFPGILSHGGFTLERTVNILVFEYEGFYGRIVRIVGAWVALFILYAGLMQAYGAFSLIQRASSKVTHYIRSGVSQSAVVSSMFIGSINGAATANAAMTGSFTIPLMKENGIESKTAAAIEAVASSGGQIMPPIMGASAFIMASLLGISYFEVIIAGLLPSFIFYASVFVAVHYSTIRHLERDLTSDNVALDEDIGELTENLEDIEAHSTPDQIQTNLASQSAKTKAQLLVDGLKFLIPLIVLIYTLGVVQWTVMRAALYTISSMILTGTLFPIFETLYNDPSEVSTTVIDVISETVEGFRVGMITLAPIVIIIVSTNGIITLLTTSGMPAALSLALIELSGGILAIAAVLAMVACILLGLGMPTSAAYVLVALLIAPSLINNFAIPDLSVHYFVFYAAILSAITPPIAIACVITCGIADSGFWETCVTAIRIAFPLFVLPFAFLFNPEIISGEITGFRLLSGSLVLLGALSISFGMNYRQEHMYRSVNYIIGSILVILGIGSMVYPGIYPRVFLLLMIFIFVGLLKTKRVTEWLTYEKTG